MITQTEYIELLPFRSGPVEHLDGPTPMIKHLVSKGFLEVSETNYIGDFTIIDIQWRLTPKGEIALCEMEEYTAQEECRRAEQETAEARRLKERHEDHAREERYHQTQNRVSIISAVLGACVAFLLGLLAEYYTGAITAILSWFH